MFKITRTEKHGGFWDGNSIVKEIETDNAEFVASYKGKEGYSVEEFTPTLDKLNVPQLKKYAKEHGIDLGEATQKEPILEIIRAAEAQ